MTDEITMPDAMARRPFDPEWKLPVPWVNEFTQPHPHYNFKELNPTRVTIAAKARYCGLCGSPMGYWVAFIGGPTAVESRRYNDGPMHPDCATTALRLCPHLAKHDPGSRVMVYVTRTYKIRTMQQGKDMFSVFIPAPFKRLDEYVYDDDGELRPVALD